MNWVDPSTTSPGGEPVFLGWERRYDEPDLFALLPLTQVCRAWRATVQPQ